MTPLFLAAETTESAAAHGPIAHGVELAVLLLSVAAVVAVLTRFIKAPYTIALVVAGLGLALSGLTPHGARITQDLVLVLFLPPLLFQAGLHLRLELLRKVWAPVLLMALPGVVLTAFAVAAAVKPILSSALGAEFATWPIVLLFGVVLAPTDPISVMATFKAVGAPDKLKTVVKGESLFNDGTAVAIFALFKTAVFAGVATGATGDASPAEVSVIDAAISFVTVTGIGTLIGLGLGFIAWLLLRHLEDHTLETAITIALAWGAFVLAEKFHASGVIATVVAALLIGNQGVLHMSSDTRSTLTGFWDSVDFVVNSILFLLIGIELADPAIGGVHRLIQPNILLAAGASFGALLIARAIVSYPVSIALKSHWPSGWKHVVFWSGLKGSLTLALILGLPDGELRAFFAPVAFLVVLASLIGQGLTMPLLMKRVDMGGAEWFGDDH